MAVIRGTDRELRSQVMNKKRRRPVFDFVVAVNALKFLRASTHLFFSFLLQSLVRCQLP